MMDEATKTKVPLSKWYMAAVKELGGEINYDAVREQVYGMAFNEWKNKCQKKASDAQMETFESTKPLHAVISGHNK